jgi:hypothetical protein
MKARLLLVFDVKAEMKKEHVKKAMPLSCVRAMLL